MKSQLKRVALAAATLLLSPMLTTSAVAAQHAMVYKDAAVDTGAAAADTTIDLALSFHVLNKAQLQTFVASTVDRNSRNFRKFITPAQFATRYGQSPATVARVKTFLESHGLTVTEVFPNNLGMMVKATNGQAARLFDTEIHRFVKDGVVSQRPLRSPAIPAVLADVVAHVAGLNTTAKFHTNLHTIPAELKSDRVKVFEARSAAQPNAIPAPGVAGQYTVNDFANLYNVTPLYSAGITGAGRTVGILTFANFTPANVGTYWAAVGTNGLNSSVSRISTVNVIPGSTITNSGADETTLDVQQSGGVAPGANVIVYEAPNTDAGAVALFQVAINANIADTLSQSWGEAEIFYDVDAGDLVPYDNYLLQAAAQGIPVTASSGDAGAYDINAEGYPYPNYSTLLSVDFPASSPYVLAAGGTTLPVTLKLGTTTITVPAERPWAWDYLRSYIISAHNEAYYYTNDWPVGGGGGVSVQYPLPDYQQGLAGTMSSAAGQSLFCFTSPTAASGNATCTPGADLADLPAGYAGRNLPDVSTNADPESGYTLYYGTTAANAKYSTGNGGTSFVAPQLNGVFALISQKIGGRVGWPHPQLYSLFKAQGYGAGSPFRSIAFGSNEYYTSTAGYNPATGLGSLDVNALANALTK